MADYLPQSAERSPKSTQWSSPTVLRHFSELNIDDTRETSMVELRNHVQHMESDAIPRFVNTVNDSSLAESESRTYAVGLYSECARTHGSLVLPHVPKIISSIMRQLAQEWSSFSFHRACADVLLDIARLVPGDETQSEDLMDNMAEILAHSLDTDSETLADGATVCLHTLIMSEMWPYVSKESLDIVWRQTLRAISDPFRLISTLKVAQALIRKSDPIPEEQAGILLTTCKEVLSKSAMWQLTVHAIKLAREILTRCDQSFFFNEVEAMGTALDSCRNDEEALDEVHREATDLIDLLTALKENWSPMIFVDNSLDSLHLEAPLEDRRYSGRFQTPIRRLTGTSTLSQDIGELNPGLSVSQKPSPVSVKSRIMAPTTASLARIQETQRELMAKKAGRNSLAKREAGFVTHGRRESIGFKKDDSRVSKSGIGQLAGPRSRPERSLSLVSPAGSDRLASRGSEDRNFTEPLLERSLSYKDSETSPKNDNFYSQERKLNQRSDEGYGESEESKSGMDKSHGTEPQPQGDSLFQEGSTNFESKDSSQLFWGTTSSSSVEKKNNQRSSEKAVFHNMGEGDIVALDPKMLLFSLQSGSPDVKSDTTQLHAQSVEQEVNQKVGRAEAHVWAVRENPIASPNNSPTGSARHTPHKNRTPESVRIRRMARHKKTSSKSSVAVRNLEGSDGFQSRSEGEEGEDDSDGSHRLGKKGLISWVVVGAVAAGNNLSEAVLVGFIVVVVSFWVAFVAKAFMQNGGSDVTLMPT